MIRALGAGDEPALAAFLIRHADFSMFLRSIAEREDAKWAYVGIGFRVVGEYGPVLFAGKEATRYEGDAESPGRRVDAKE